MPDNRPIGVFDSGVGGLTVLRALQHSLPGESTVYLGDLARCPYGVRDQAEVRAFAVQIGDYLASTGIKLLVIACNTATAAAFNHLRERYAFPVIGVVEPGAREACRISQSGRIGVIATDGTVRSGAYRQALLRQRPEVVVVERSASWLVPLVERGAPARETVATGLQPVMDEMRTEGIDTLILGCTHFPLVQDIFEEEIGPGVTLLDSAATTARAVQHILRESGLQSSRLASHRVLVTGPAQAFRQRVRAMFHALVAVEVVNLDQDEEMLMARFGTDR